MLRSKLIDTPSNPKKIDVIGLSADDCILNAYFYQQPECLGDVIKANLHLIKKWVEEIKAYGSELVIFTVCSKQQSEQLDKIAREIIHPVSGVKSMSIFKVIDLICKETKRLLQEMHSPIPCIVDKNLSADILNSQKPGTAFDLSVRAMQGESIPFHSLTVNDVSHLLSLYAQAQRIPAIYPGAHVRYTVHDGSEKVQGELVRFFKTNFNLKLIPRSVTLRLRAYNGLSIKTLEYKGLGEIDFYYEETVKQMIWLAGINTCDTKTYQIEHDICGFYSKSQNIAQLKLLKKFIAEKNTVCRTKSLLTFKSGPLGTITEENEEQDIVTEKKQLSLCAPYQS